jgi:hypothetical protein
MDKELAKELHAPVVRNYPRRKVFVDGISNTHAMDLVDMSEWKHLNDSMAWMLNIVDVFSRFAWSIPLPNKSAAVVLNAFRSVIEQSHRKPKKIWVDEGKEFYNKLMDAYIKKEGIIRYSTYGEHKSMFVERFNRTLKGRMWRRFTEENTRRWVDMLPSLMSDYNSSVHRSIKMTPIEASDVKNERSLMIDQTPGVVASTPTKPPKFKLGQWVRISREKGKFEKGYLPNWSREIFKVVSILNINPRVYGLLDRSGEPIKGSFYEQNLKKTKETPTSDGLIETVLQTRTVRGQKQFLVKWLGYPSSFNKWIKESDVTRVW